jgi:hypothetical protein
MNAQSLSERVIKRLEQTPTAQAVLLRQLADVSEGADNAQEFEEQTLDWMAEEDLIRAVGPEENLRVVFGPKGKPTLDALSPQEVPQKK